MGGVIYVKTSDNGGNDSNNGAAWDTALATISNALTKATDGDEIRVAAGTYKETITISKSISLLGGYSAEENDTQDYVTNVTALDGAWKGYWGNVSPLIYNTADSLIEGFTIQSDDACSKAALENSDANITIRFCIFTNNSGAILNNGSSYATIN